MNKIYKVIWSKARNCYVVVSELAKRNGKDTTSTDKRRKVTSGLAMAAMAVVLNMGIAGSAEADSMAIGGKSATSSDNSIAVGNSATTIRPFTTAEAQVKAYNALQQTIKGSFTGTSALYTAVRNATTYTELVTALNNVLNNASSAAAKTAANNYITQLNDVISILQANTANYPYTANNAIAIGNNATAANTNAIAVGAGETISRQVRRQGTADSDANNRFTTITPTGAYGSYDIAIGKAAAYGNRTSATTGNSTNDDTDIGGYYDTTGGAGRAIAVGFDALAVRQDTIAAGSYSMAAGQYAIAVGANARALTPYSVAIGGGPAGQQGIQGRGAINTPLDSPDQGGSSITIGNANNFTYGYVNTDDYYANTKNSVAIGYLAHTHAANAFAIGTSTDATAERSFAIGTASTSNNATKSHQGASARGQGSVVFGDSAEVLANNPEPFGTGDYERATDTRLNDAMAIGTNTKAQARNAVALGGGMSYTYHVVSDIDGSDLKKMENITKYYDGTNWVDTAKGSGASVGLGADGAVAIGGASGEVTGIDSTHFPERLPTNVKNYTAAAKATVAKSVALGTGSVANRAAGSDASGIERSGYDVLTNRAYAGPDSNSPTWKSTLAAFSVGDAANGLTRQITNVAAGYEDTDAVNVAQLKRAASLDTDNRNVGLSINANGSREITSPYIHIEGVEAATEAYNNALAAYITSAAYTSLPDADKPAALQAKIDELRNKTYSGTYNRNNAVYQYNYRLANASGEKSVAIGASSAAAGDYSAAVGYNAAASGSRSNAYGYGSIASGEDSTAIGRYAQAIGNQSIALGYGESTSYRPNTDFYQLISSGYHSIAIGYSAHAKGYGSTSLGQFTRATGISSTALGYTTVASGEGATAFGIFTEAKGKNSTAFGYNAHAIGNYSVAFGGKYEIRVTPGGSIGYLVHSFGEGSTAFGAGTEARGAYSTAFGSKTEAIGKYSTAFGSIYLFYPNGPDSDKYTPVPEGATWYRLLRASGDYSTAFGAGTQARGEYSTTFGALTTATGKYSTAFGFESTAGGENSLAALGATTETTATNSFAIGKGAKATLADSIALGSEAVANTAAGSVGIDTTGADHTKDATGVWKSTQSAVSIGDAANSKTRQLTGLAAGTVDTDAVNVAQLKQLQWNIGTGTINASETKFLKPVGGDKHDVVMRAGDGVRITATERTSGYDIEFSSYFTNLETTVPGGNFIDSITYKGKPYYINGGGSGIVDAISDNRAVIVAPDSVDILNDQGEVTGKRHYLKIHSPYININGLSGTEFYDQPQDYFALAQKSGSMAIGIHSKAAEENSTAIGHNADAMGLDSTAIGYNSHAHGNNSVAIGIASTTSGNRAIAIGTSASNTSNKDYNPTNPHQGARAAGMGAIALGDRAMVLSSEYLSDDKYVDNPQPDDSVNDAIAIGTRTQARARNAIAVGGDTSYTYKDETGKIVTIYGADDNVQGGRNYGAVVGDGAHSGIAIGGAYGSFDNETKTIHQEMDAAATYGIRGIAIGSGALVANPDDFADLKEALSDSTYVNIKRDFHTARSNHLEAKAEWDAIKDLTINDPSLPEGMRVDQIKYDAAKEKYESTLQKMNEATAKYSMALKEVVRLQVKDSVLEEDAIAIGTLANASIRDSVALGSHSITDSNDKAGSRTGISGYDPLGKASDNDYFRGDSNYDEDDPVWRSTAGSLSVGGTYYKKDTNGNYETDDDGNLVVDKVITRRISHVAAGVKDSDAVNVAQLKRATTISSDSRNTALGVDENGNMIVNSPFLAISGVEESSDNNTIVRKYRNSGGADGYVNGLQQESDEIQGRIDSINATRAEIDKALNGYTDGNGKFVDGIEQKYEKRLALEKQYKTGQITRERYLEESADLITVEDYTLHKTEYTDQLIATEARLKDLEESQKVYTDLLADNGKKAKEKYTEAETYFNSQANADGTDSMAVGHKSKAGGKQSIAIGKNNEVGTTGEIENKDSEAIKAKREKEAANSVALGIGNKITGTANTESSTESMTLGVGNTITNANKAMAIGSGNIVEGDKSLAIGTENEVYGTGSGAIGDPSIIIANNSYSIGNNNTIGGKGKDEDASVTLNNVFILGNNSSVDVNDTVVLGSNIHILEGMPESSVFLGNNAGYTSDTNVTGGATGTVSNATVGNITFGGFAGDTANGVVSVGYQGEIDGAPATTVRRIQNVAAGLISAESTDAINGSQLYAAIQAMSIDVKDDGTTTKVDKQTTTGGGGGGTGTAATTYTVKGSVTTIERGTNAVANNNLTLKEEKTGDPTSYKYTIDMSNNLKVDSVTAGDTAITKNEVKATTFKAGDTTVNSSGITINNGPSMTKDGIDMKDKKITNVKAGEADNDAVNYGQLKDYVANNNQAVTNLGNQITGVENRMKKGLAGAAALAALHPMDFDPDDKLTFAAGMGHYRGENAAALGLFYRPDEKVMFSLGGTLGNGENMINAGVSFSLDRTPRVTGSRTALTKEVVQLREHVAKQDAQIAELTALVRQLAGNAGLQVPASSALPTEGPALFADNLDNKWVYDAIEDLEQRGYFNGYAGRALTRQQIAAALDMAMAGGAKLDERIVKEFEPELSHVRVAHVEGKGNEEGEWYERPRASHDKYEDKHKIEKKPFRVEEKKATSKS